MSANQELSALVQRLEAVAIRLEKSQPGSVEGKLYKFLVKTNPRTPSGSLTYSRNITKQCLSLIYITICDKN